MNGTLSWAQELASELRNSLGSCHGADIVVFPPTAFLGIVQGVLRGGSVKVGAQDVHPEASGAYTSGCSVEMVTSFGCRWTLVGHSERRAWFGDSDARVGAKLSAALEGGLTPILCVGESLSEREAGQTFAVVARQLDSAFGSRSPDTLGGVVIAYEPVWAIGTGLTASPAQAQDVHAFIRKHVAASLGEAFAAGVRIQYGGSVSGDNAAALLSCPDIDGALVGGASLKPLQFTRIVRAATRKPVSPGVRR